MKIIGHRDVLKKINHLLDAGTIGHAYLFVGPAHVGKTTVAHAFASALVSGEVMCGELLTHPDLQIIRPEQSVAKSGSVRTKDIGVETAREITTDAMRTPLAGVRRVIIITEADRLTTAAQNALLKTLEEPATKTVVIMTAVREGRLLQTVRSRTQRMSLTPVSDAEMMAVAEGFFDGDMRADAASAAHGCPGILMACAADEDVLAWYKKMMNDAQDLPTMTQAQKLAYAGVLAQDAVQLQRGIVVWMHVWRQQLEQGDASRAEMLAHAQAALDALEDTNANPRLVIEHFLLALT